MASRTRKRVKPVAQEPAKDQATTVQDKEEAPQNFGIDVQLAPEGVFPPEEDKEPNVLESVLGKLGIKKTEEDTRKPTVPVSAKLNKAQEAFCDMTTPVGTNILIVCVGWAWTRLGEEYRILAPSKDAATDIIAPLVRIYARSNKALVGSVSPNTVDAFYALNASVMYLYSSLTVFEEIQKRKREEAEDERDRPRDIRSSQARPDRADARRADFSEPADAQHASNSNGSGTASSPANLTERERSQYESLSRLREQDIASRARRSGRYA